MATAATTMELGTYRHRPRSRITPVVSVQVERVTQVFIGQRSTKDSRADVDADFEEDVADVKTSMGSEVGRSDVEVCSFSSNPYRHCSLVCSVPRNPMLYNRSGM